VFSKELDLTFANHVIHVFIFISSFVLLAVCAGPAYSLSGDFHQYEHHFAIKGDYIYVMPGSGDSPGKKIEKKTGQVIWTSDFAEGFHCSTPIFVDGHFFTMTLGGAQETSLFRVSCESGQSTKEHDFEIGCTFPAFIYTPILCGDLLVAFTSDDVLAMRLTENMMAWELSCKRKDLVFLYDITLRRLFELPGPAGPLSSFSYVMPGYRCIILKARN